MVKKGMFFLVALLGLALMWVISRPGSTVTEDIYAESNIDDSVTEEEIEPTETPTPTNKLKILIDPGHGGKDYGAPVNGIYEKDIVLSIANKISEKFKDDDEYEIYLTRYDDSYPMLNERLDEARRYNVDIMISIHANSNDSASVSGVETYSSEDAEDLAIAVHDSLMSHIDLRDRGIRGDNGYYILTNSTVPTLLIETGFMTNADDFEKLVSDEFQEKIALGIYEGIKKNFQ